MNQKYQLKPPNSDPSTDSQMELEGQSINTPTKEKLPTFRQSTYENNQVQQQQFEQPSEISEISTQEQNTLDDKILKGLDRYECDEKLDDEDHFLYYEAKLKTGQDEDSDMNFRIYRQDHIREDEKKFIEYLIKFQQEFENSHPNSQFPSNVVRIYEFFEQDNYIYIVMEEISNDLKTELYRNLQQEEPIKISQCKQIAEAIRFLHLNENVHRSVRPEDFVKAGQVLKLKNFSFLKQQSGNLRNTCTKIELNEYSAPELVFKQQRNNKSLDIWSLGMIFYEIFQGQQIIDKTIMNNIKNKNLGESQIKSIMQKKLLELKAQEEIRSLITNMLSWDESKRPQIQQVIYDLEKLISQRVLKEDQVNYLYLVNSLISAPTQQDPERKFHLIKLLGDGTEGGVFKAKCKNDSKYKDSELAIKIQSKFKVGEQKFINQLIVDQKNNSANYLIKVYEFFQWNDKLIIVMELGKQDLYNYLLENPKLTNLQKEKIIFEITQQIKYIHSINLMHRDIKPENFLLINSTFKLIDFGLIKEKQEKQESRLTKNIGTPLYKAPELVEGKDDYSFGVDIWALGCMFFEIFSGQPLFGQENVEKVQLDIMNYKVNQESINEKIEKLEISDQWKQLIKNMIHPDEAKRYTIEIVAEKIPQQQPKFNQQFVQTSFFQNPQKTNIFPQKFQSISSKKQEKISYDIDTTVKNVIQALKSSINRYDLESFKVWRDVVSDIKNLIEKIFGKLNDEISSQQQSSNNLFNQKFPAQNPHYQTQFKKTQIQQINPQSTGGFNQNNKQQMLSSPQFNFQSNIPNNQTQFVNQQKFENQLKNPIQPHEPMTQHQAVMATYSGTSSQAQMQQRAQFIRGFQQHQVLQTDQAGNNNPRYINQFTQPNQNNSFSNAQSMGPSQQQQQQ